MKRGKKRRRRHKINRCILKPTGEQLEAAYEAVKSWAKQHATFIENASGDDFWMNVTEGHGCLSVYWPTFVTYNAKEFAVENGKGRIFAFRSRTNCVGYYEPLGVILDIYFGILPKKVKRGVGYRTWKRLERKYLRWVRRHF